MAPGRSETRGASAGEARAYLGQAGEYLHAAQESLSVGNYNAAAGNAVVAGIAGADAIAAARLRAVWRGEHDQAPRHLETAGAEGKDAARHLRRLLPLKTRAQYDPVPVSAAAARAAVTAAERLVAISKAVVGQLDE